MIFDFFGEPQSQTCGFRPVFTLKPDVNIVEGTGKDEESAYILQK